MGRHMRDYIIKIKWMHKATPIKCLDLDDISGQLKLEGWLYNGLIFYALFNEEAPF